MTGAYDWQGRVGTNWAREWMRTDRSFAGLNAVLVARAAALWPVRVLDLGCGAGETAIAVAAQCPDAAICGIDLSADLIDAAQARAGARVRFAVGDATRWQDAGFRPDLLLSRHGVMFFDDPVAAFVHIRSVAAPGARLLFSCFRDRAENDWAVETAAAVGAAVPGDPHAPGPFAFADRVRVADILSRAGWRDVGFEAVDWDYVAGGGADPVADAVDFFGRIGPAGAALARMEDDARTDAITALREVAERNRHGDVVRFRAAAWIVTAQG